ncbi:hypothetical protein ACGK9R_16105 [Halomonas sp. HNIBRBA4712]|uniref:hypothetical protein n=1 Tax=Halomonas sp. HNIBRBA4712 TaxID=3373087 RepID=UPI003745F326
MSKLPKSITLDGRRYPTWALTAKAQDHINQIREVDAHMELLRTRMDYHLRLRGLFSMRLQQALGSMAAKEPSCFWHTVPPRWFASNWPVSSSFLPLEMLEAQGLYQPLDCLVLYAKGSGVIGWGVVQTTTSGPILEWRCRAHAKSTILPAKTIRHLGMRHPTRSSQRIPPEANINELLDALASNVALADPD